MELRQVRYVVAIARHGSFTAAAAELRIAQPALSRQIQQIEREIGVLLFDRSRRQISPTPAGLAFVARADTLLSDVLALREEMQEFAGLLRGRVVIGALQSLAELRLPGMLAAFHQRYPGITVALREGNSGPLIDSLLAGQLDLALVHRIGTMQQAPAAWQGIEIEPLYTEGLVLIMAPTHRLAHREQVPLADARDEPFVASVRGSALWQALVDACAGAGFSPRIAFEGGELHIVRALVHEGLGLALVPRSVATGTGIHAATLVPSAPTRIVSLAWRRERSRAAASATLLDFAREYLRDPEAGTGMPC